MKSAMWRWILALPKPALFSKLSLKASAVLLIAILIVTVSTALLAVIITFYASDKRADQQARADQLVDLQQSVLVSALWDLDQDRTVQILETFKSDPDFLYVEVLEEGAEAPVSTGQQPISGAETTSATKPIVYGEGETATPLGTLTLVLSQDSISASISLLLYGGLLAAAIIMAVLLTGVWVVVGSVTGPVTKITEVMTKIANDQLDVDVPYTSRAGAIGGMAKTVSVFKDNAVEKQSMEVADQKHELARSKVVAVLRSKLSALSQGDLTVQITETFPEDYEQLRRDFNASTQNLSATVEQVIAAAGSIRNGAGEISQASDELSNRTESQAATLEETAAALDELTASVKSAADGARSVEATMEDAKGEARSSGEVVQSAVAAMTEIEQSSAHISQIISVIDDIAFQTNLLALNAGVEAARAGEAGRGFAVVASEVRALAQRSSDAAMEIKTLIGNSSQQVARGVDLVGKAGEALQSIVSQVSHISQLVSDIAEGAAEQSTGLGEINTGMTQLDQVTQQNAAMVEQATAAGHMLKTDATKLSDLVTHFKITGGSQRAAPAEAARSSVPSARSSDNWDTQPAPQLAAVVEGNAATDLWQNF